MLENLLRGIPKSVADAVKAFLQSLIKEIGDVEVYLFGSYARGDWVEDSDIDLVVISSRFRGMRMCDRMSMLRKLAPDTHAFEILAYTPEEFEVIKHSIVVGDAMEYWMKLL